jgi:hypothetical protein
MDCRQTLVAAGLALTLASCGSPEPVGADQAGGASPDGAVADAAVADQQPAESAVEAAPEGPGSEAPADAKEAAELDAAPEQDVDAGDGPIDTPGESPPTEAGEAGDAGDAPVSLLCGDGIRDPKTEECDDGLGPDAGTDRACTASCVVTDRLAVLGAIRSRRIGDGPHPAACGAAGHAVALTEEHHPWDGGARFLAVATFGATGQRAGVVRLADPSDHADPVLAALPDGSFALAYEAHGSGASGLDVMLARVATGGASVSVVGQVNTSTYGPQHSVDMVWTGQELVLAWIDLSLPPSPLGSGARVCTRRYGPTLQALSGESCGPERPAMPTKVALASAGATVAKAWLEATIGVLSLLVDLAGGTVSITGGGLADGGLAASDAAPGLAWLDATHLLGTFADAAGSHWAVVVDSGGAVALGPVLLNPAPAQSRLTPRAAVTPDGAYLVWQSPTAPGSPDAGWLPTYDELWLQKVVWSGTTLDTTTYSPIPLPRVAAHQLDSQRKPAMAACPGAPLRALFAAWNDWTSNNYPGESAHGDAIVELIPTPVLRGKTP